MKKSRKRAISPRTTANQTVFPAFVPTKRWISSPQDVHSKTAYVSGTKVQIDCTKCDQNAPGYAGLYFCTLTINGPNESYVILLEKKGTLPEINSAVAERLRSMASDLILLADEIRPNISSLEKGADTHEP